MEKVSAVIVTYNGEEYIKRCLNSLLNSNYQVKIIVVDNNSQDNTTSIISKHYSSVLLIEAGSNLGFGKANNIGIEKAIIEKSDYVFLLNQDAWIEKDTIEKLINIAKINTEYGIISPLHLNKEGSRLEAKFAEYAGPDNTPDLLSDSLLNIVKPIYQCNFVNAACWLLTAQCIQKVGVFSPIFPHYGEDQDYINRLHYWGLKVGLCPGTRIYHDREFSWEKIKYQTKKLMVFNIVKLTNINTTLRSAILLYVKKTFDEVTTSLLFRKFKFAYVSAIVFFKVMGKLVQIIKTRKSNRKTLN